MSASTTVVADMTARALHRFALHLAAVLALECSFGASAAIIYVNAGLATGANNGTSWTDAYRGPQGLRNAMAAAVAGDELWVVAGVYRASTSERTVSHVLRNDVKVYGGFAGGETLLSQRDWTKNETVMSGDLNSNDVPGSSSSLNDNSHHVVTSLPGTLGLIDGFEIRAGNANGSGVNDFDKGGGVILGAGQSPTFRNCRFNENRCFSPAGVGGGAGYVQAAAPKFLNCIFAENNGSGFGGALHCSINSQPVIEGCAFIASIAARGGAIECVSNSTPTVTNCLFTGNQATGAGGGAAIWIGGLSNGTFRNLTISANHAALSAGGVLNFSGSSTFTNVISFGNTGFGPAADHGIKTTGGVSTITYSNVQGIVGGTGNIDVDPQFENPPFIDGLRLKATSPCIDVGSNPAVPAGTTTDLDGHPRFVDIASAPDGGSGTAPIVDMGAYEEQSTPPPPCPADFNDDGVVDGNDLGTLLGTWGACRGCPADFNGDTFVDGNDLGSLLGFWGACP